jgi:hypothetical protein
VDFGWILVPFNTKNKSYPLIYNLGLDIYVPHSPLYRLGTIRVRELMYVYGQVDLRGGEVKTKQNPAYYAPSGNPDIFPLKFYSGGKHPGLKL